MAAASPKKRAAARRATEAVWLAEMKDSRASFVRSNPVHKENNHP